MKKRNQRANKLAGKRILHILTGSIAAYKAGDLIKALRVEGADVTCILTPSAEKFVTPLTLRAISGNPVYSDSFDVHTPHDVLHTSLAERADLILAAPASANFIARLAAGFADDLGTCVILASDSPVVVVPAMNDLMYSHKLTQRNMQTIRNAGYHVIEPVAGDLVCGKTAIGHIAEFSNIVEKITGFIPEK